MSDGRYTFMFILLELGRVPVSDTRPQSKSMCEGEIVTAGTAHRIMKVTGPRCRH